MLYQSGVEQRRSFWTGGIYSVCLLVIIILPFTSFSQDKIYKTDNTIIQARVQEVSDAEIKYKKFSNPNGPLYSVKKENVRMIVYENGEKEVYNPALPKQEVQKPVETKRSGINIPADEFNNTDIIISADGERIFCTIESIDKTGLSYRIKRRGSDPVGFLALDLVVKYYRDQQWFHGLGVGPDQDNARKFILTGQINEAISAYFLLIQKDSNDVTLLAEDAYTLALGGVYDAALMRLDRCWSLGANTPDVNYFTAQVFSLMGYDELAPEFWKADGKYKAPAWIASLQPQLSAQYRAKSPATTKATRDELIFNFKLANELAARNKLLESIALFHKTIDLCPDQYTLYTGYSIALEKAGALDQSLQATDKAISLVGYKAEDRDKRQFLEQRRNLLSRKLASSKADELPGLHEISTDPYRPQMMAFAGFMLAPDVLNINGRIGYFISGSSNASFDFGVAQNAGVSSVNLGLSGYFRKNVLVCGAGLQLFAGNNNTTVSVKISLGISVKSKNQTSSFDVFIDGYSGLQKNSITSVGLSIGKSLYFGKRK